MKPGQYIKKYVERQDIIVSYPLWGLVAGVSSRKGLATFGSGMKVTPP